MRNYLPLILLIATVSCKAQDQTLQQQIDKIASNLENKKISVAEIIKDSSLLALHPLPEFRELIRKNSNDNKIVITTATEPGDKIFVKARVVDTDGEPLKAANIYCYQTDVRGYYAADAPHFLENEGDRRHARLFGYGTTNSNGEFSIETIRPNGYPQSTLPGHIHVEISATSGNKLITEFLFDNDPRLTPEIRESSLRSGFLISEGKGGVYEYSVQMR